MIRDPVEIHPFSSTLKGRLFASTKSSQESGKNMEKQRLHKSQVEDYMWLFVTILTDPFSFLLTWYYSRINQRHRRIGGGCRALGCQHVKSTGCKELRLNWDSGCDYPNYYNIYIYSLEVVYPIIYRISTCFDHPEMVVQVSTIAWPWISPRKEQPRCTWKRLISYANHQMWMVSKIVSSN